MVKRAHRLLPTNRLSGFDHFVGLAPKRFSMFSHISTLKMKGLNAKKKLYFFTYDAEIQRKFKYSTWHPNN